MLDFSWSEHTLGNVLYCTVTYGLFIAVFYKRYVSYAHSQSTKTNLWLFLFSLVLLISACIDTDWFHYQDMVKSYDLTIGAYNYGEPIYGEIVRIVNRNYLCFRLVVWGLAFVLTCIAFRRFEVNINIAVFYLTAVFLITFNYARATLGMASFFVGLSYLLKPCKGGFLVRLALIAFFFWAAYEFHHSMLVLLFLAPVVVILPLDKPYILLIVLFALPFLASLIGDSFFLVDQLENEYLSDKFNRNLEREGIQANIFGIIQSIINYGVFVIPLFFDTIALSRNRRLVSATILKLYRVTISLVIFALSFLFLRLNSALFIYRILYMSFIPLTIISVYLYEQQFMNRLRYKVIIWWGVLAISFSLLHLIYVNM